jgi:hypothetical protein
MSSHTWHGGSPDHESRSQAPIRVHRRAGQGDANEVHDRECEPIHQSRSGVVAEFARDEEYDEYEHGGEYDLVEWTM